MTVFNRIHLNDAIVCASVKGQLIKQCVYFCILQLKMNINHISAERAMTICHLTVSQTHLSQNYSCVYLEFTLSDG